MRPGIYAMPGGRLFEGACAVCHEPGAPALFGAKPSLALNSNVHSNRPDNLIQVVLNGIDNPAHPDLGAMPAFGPSFSDAQIAELVAYIRGRFAPGKPAWEGLEATVQRLRPRAPAR